MRVLLYMLLLPLLTLSEANALDRCNQYVKDVRKAHWLYFGLDYPYQYGVAQLEKESACRHVISKDGHGSSTPAQITYKFWQKTFERKGLASSHWTIQQAFIMKEAHNSNPHKKLWVTYQMYNGGNWVLREIDKAGSLDWKLARSKCTRGYTHYKSGSVSNCDINYDYSVRLYKYGSKYGNIESDRYEYW
jgi:hypothetical protein